MYLGCCNLGQNRSFRGAHTLSFTLCVGARSSTDGLCKGESGCDGCSYETPFGAKDVDAFGRELECLVRIYILYGDPYDGCCERIEERGSRNAGSGRVGGMERDERSSDTGDDDGRSYPVNKNHPESGGSECCQGSIVDGEFNVARDGAQRRKDLWMIR